MHLRKHLYELVSYWKLYPSRTGLLHEISKIERRGAFIYLLTKCGYSIRVRDSKTSRSARWLRTALHHKSCRRCKIRKESLEKYSTARIELRDSRKREK